MLKRLTQFIILASLGLMGTSGLYLGGQLKAAPAQAKEVNTVILAQPGTSPAARPVSASFNITVNEVIAQGLAQPVQVTHARDGSGRLFVVEQAGRIKIIKNGNAPIYLSFSNKASETIAFTWLAPA